MRTFIGLILLFVAACAPAPALEATAVVSKDSLAFEIPLPDGVAVDTWEIRIRRGGWTGRESLGTARIFMGPESEPGRRSITCHWKLEHEQAPPRGASSSAPFSVENQVVRFTFKDPRVVEPVTRIRPMHATLRGARADGSTYETRVTATWLKDPREAEARKVSGPFSADEYAIYQTIIDRAHQRFGPEPKYPFIVVTPTTVLRGFASPDDNALYFKMLGVDDDTGVDFVAKRTAEENLSSLTALGYDVMDQDAFMKEFRSWSRASGEKRRSGVYVSPIGFNKARTQALIFSSNSSESEVIRLDKVDGEWLVTRRLLLGQA